MKTIISSPTPFKIFTPGPTKIADDILKIGTQQLPYNRTISFSKITFEIIDRLKYVFQTKGDVAILTSSGTGAMEASTFNFFDKNDLVLVINGGTFGERWSHLCKIHNIPFVEINLESGQDIPLERIEKKFKSGGFTGLLINAHETSTGALYDIENIGKLTKKYNVLFIVDAISSICADIFLMDQWHVDVAILSSQKALALPPGLSFIALNEKAKEKMNVIPTKSLYFDLKNYLKNQERGQMPYTPAIGLFLMLHKRLEEIEKVSIENVIKRHSELANFFRASIKELPLTILPKRPSNAMTALRCNKDINASKIVDLMVAKYHTYLASNGSPLNEEVFRVSHMGVQTKNDVKLLVMDLKKAIKSDRGSFS
jgi:aspartate aminotransferase-like enzyme